MTDRDNEGKFVSKEETDRRMNALLLSRVKDKHVRLAARLFGIDSGGKKQ